MTKNSFYKYAAIALLLLHFVVIGFFVIKKSSHKRHKFVGPKNIIIKRLGFDKEQQASYQKLIDGHSPTIKAAQKSIEPLKHELYRSLKNEVQTQGHTDSLINEISLVEQKIERTHYAHFLDIKGLCKGEQLEKFDALTEDLAMLFTHGKGPKKQQRGE